MMAAKNGDGHENWKAARAATFISGEGWKDKKWIKKERRSNKEGGGEGNDEHA
jgi:hypothetical protein